MLMQVFWQVLKMTRFLYRFFEKKKEFLVTPKYNAQQTRCNFGLHVRVTTDTRKDERNNFFQQKLNELKKLTMEKIKTAVKASIWSTKSKIARLGFKELETNKVLTAVGNFVINDTVLNC